MSETNDTLLNTRLWFEEAVPLDKLKDPARALQVQLGCHFEEVVELLETLQGRDRITQAMLTSSLVSLHGLALHLKASGTVQVVVNSRTEFLDALCDQIVTAIGSGYLAQTDIVQAMNEVNESNFSKFVDGKAIFNEQGKIAKGPNYFKADLSKYV